MQIEDRSVVPDVSAARPVKESSFRELFSIQEIGYYAAAIVVYFVLGLVFRDKVLNIGIGPLFFVVWIWVVPVLWDRITAKVRGR